MARKPTSPPWRRPWPVLPWARGGRAGRVSLSRRPGDSGKKHLMNYTDLSEHVGALVSLLGLFAGVSGLLVWRMLVRLEKKVDELLQDFFSWREDLGERF